MAENQDLIVVGGGSWGFAAAIRAAQLGGKVAVVEETRIGGKCMNHNCIPLTFLITAARRMNAIREAGHYGIRVEGVELDLIALHDEKDLLVEALRMGTRERLADHGVELVEGRGKLIAPSIVEVGGREIDARSVILATGSVSAQLPVEGADLPRVIDTEEAIALREIPARVAVIGNQAWDLEFAQYFHWIGAQVTVIAEGRQLIPDADREISQRFAKLLHDAGIGVQRGAAVEAIRPAEDGTLVVVLVGGGGEVRADIVLAARRFPNSSSLGLRDLGVKMEGGAVLVDERMQTNVPHLYAIGDLTAGPMWSHKANAEATVAQLMDIIPAHPSIGEALVDAAMDVEKRSLHLPKW